MRARRQVGHLTVKTFLNTLLVVWLTSGCPYSALAEILLDDFADPAEVIGEGSFDMPGVGDLSAVRHLGLGGLRADVIGSLDANITRQSQLTAKITGLGGIIGLPIVSFNTGYTFENAVDLTDAGRNDAFFIELTEFEGTVRPDFLRVATRDANGIFYSHIDGSLLPTHDPVTIVVPFAAFGPRGGGPETADFTTVDLLEVLVRLTTGFDDPNQKWFAQIDRIVVGRVLPEPETGWLVVVTALSLAIGMHRSGEDRGNHLSWRVLGVCGDRWMNC